MKITAFLLAFSIAPGVFGRLDGNIATILEDTKTKQLVTPVDKEVKKRYLDGGGCYYYPCDFSELTPNAFDPNDLYDSCHLNVSSAKPINVFDSSNIKSKYWFDDPDLGSPNIKCNHPKGPGRGVGGVPNNTFENCDPLGNLLILQNPAVTTRRNYDAKGGCMTFQLYCYAYCDINDFGLLDIEEGATINIYEEYYEDAIYYDPPYQYALVGTFTIPAHIVGDNGHWIASKSTEWYEFFDTLFFNFGYNRKMEVCLNGSGAVSFIDYTECGRQPPPE